MNGPKGEMISYAGTQGPLPVYLVRPEQPGPRPALIIIHEIWGLSEHMQHVAERFAAQGYVTAAPNLFARPDLAGVMEPQALRATMAFNNQLPRERAGDLAFVQAEMSKLPPEQRALVERTWPTMMGGGMPRDSLTQDLVALVTYLKAQPFVNGRVGSLGFCFGGGMSFRLACQVDYQSAVIFYGENPQPVERVQNITCPVLGIYGAEDMRINSHLDELVREMVRYQKDFEMKIYPGAGHAFFNDTSPERYRPQQAADAFQRVLTFLARTLYPY